MAWHVGVLPQAEEVSCKVCGNRMLAIAVDICAVCQSKLDAQTLAVHTELRTLRLRLDRMEQLIAELKKGVEWLTNLE